MEAIENSRSLFLSRYQHEIPITTTAASTNPLVTVCTILFTDIGERRMAQKSIISLRAVSGLNCIPTGYCIHAFAVRIHSAEIFVPMAVSQVLSRWNFFETLSHPKYITAKKVLSIKNARIPSMASGAPKMSPTNQE